MRELLYVCERCGYRTHRLFDIEMLSEFGICADCVLDLLRSEPPEPDDIINEVSPCER